MLRMVAAMMIFILVTGCTLFKKEPYFDESMAIEKVSEWHPGYPKTPGKVSGIIHGGGPAPGITIPGEFETKVEKKSKNTYIVTLTHYWKCADFYVRSHCDKSTLSYFVSYEVTPDHLKPYQSGGDSSPYLIE
jgi:hypothetical protein